MILETTSINQTDKQLIADLVGKPFSLLKKLKLKGIRSKWMPIEKLDPNLKSYLDPVLGVNLGSIELRPNGIIININSHSGKYSWAIPYYHLVIYKTKSISIHAQGRFIQFGKNGAFKENKPFFQKLLTLKADYSTDNFEFTYS